ncbi:meiosis-specific nuclear structural protein 1-like isoform X2 [Macrobrachium rosenbergii]|uniref:meiosis-specific nuclear structural protein 1-like isoform X2 n=1 Tax=Macrobrachium rosenbergii TaxID=79674 RepID=UPI0034D4731C
MADWWFRNDAALRRQIISSSPELRALESQISACAQLQYNNAAVAEKEAKEKENKMKDREYANLLEVYGKEESFSDAISNTEKYAKKLEIQRILQEQIAEKEAIKAQLQAERTIEMLSEVDEDREIRTEKEKKQKEYVDNQRATRNFLLQQTRVKELKRQEEELCDKKLMRQVEEYNLRTDLQKGIEDQEQQLERLHLNKRELSLVKQLETFQERQEAIKNIRLEIEVLEKQDQEKQFVEEREMKEALAKLQLKEGWDKQLRYKHEEIRQEQQKEAEYRKLLLEVLAEEAKLDQLVAEARRRRQLDHRILVDRLLDERRAMRASIMRQKREEDQHAVQYEQLKKEILQEEEKQLLLKHAPQLMSYYTPKLLSKLQHLHK